LQKSDQFRTAQRRGITRGERGHNSSGAKSLRGRRKVTSTFFNAIH